MKIVQARVIVPCIHLVFLSISIYILEDLRSYSYLPFWLFWYNLARILTFISFLLYFWTSLMDPGFISKNHKNTSLDSHKESSFMHKYLAKISSIKPINPSTNTSALPHKINIESIESSKSNNIEMNHSSEESFGEQFYQLSEGDLPNLQPVEFNSKIKISKAIPFKPEPASPQIYSQEAISDSLEDDLEEEKEITPVFCNVCQLEQPIRAKHCSYCKECVAMYDHHCPFLGNCIGERNRLLFFWLVFFQASECWVGFIICWQSVGPKEDWNSWTVNNMKYILLLTLAFLLGLLITILWLFHVSLALRNLTTFESLRWEKISYLSGSISSPFSNGIAENLAYYCSFHRELTDWKLGSN